MNGLVEFLHARLKDRLENADSIHDLGCGSIRYDGTCDCGEPEMVRAEVESKRALIEENRWQWEKPEQNETDAELHARFAHPDYEYETTEGQRKTWDDADVPPFGKDFEPDYTWGRNTDAGRDGWDRFEYTEESYWRRRLPLEEIERRRQHRERPRVFLRILALPFASHPEYDESWRP